MTDTPESPPAAPAVSIPPIVVIGASAGGLEACSELLRHLSPPTDSAFVVIQHLDPTHASHLVPLLAKVSPLPVQEVEEGLVPVPGHVYVITPDTCLELREGRFHTAPRPAGRFMPIDHFLESLAVAQGPRAVAVILSGTGADGTLGAQAIKQQEGTVYAQDATAQQSGMPASVVAAGAADWVLPPAQIARALQTPTMLDDAVAYAPDAAETDALNQLFSRLKRITPVAYAAYKRTMILRRVHRRIATLRLKNLGDYVAFIDEHPDELAQLHRELLIHVTAFFRDPETFDTLRATVIPRLLKESGADRPVRIWVPGCSTGEEVYSLAICLLEALGSAPQPPVIKIFATDISDDALDKARTGRYPESIADQVSAARLREYFVNVQGGYQISKRVRDLCVFARHDMTSDPPFSNLDLISCRNVLIYLAADLQRRILPLFHYALRDQGILLLGGAESVGTLTDLFSVVDARQRIYTRKSTARRLPFNLFHGDAAFSSALAPPSIPALKASGIDFQREADRTTLAHYAPPGVIVSTDLEILQSRGDTAPYLTLAPGVASLNLLKMAREGLLLELREAIEDCRRSGQPARRESVRVKGLAQPVNIQVLPFMSGNERCFSVLFEATGGSTGMLDAAPDRKRSRRKSRAPENAASELESLRTEIADTRAHMQSMIEQLESSNEELRAANEEILSSNEELQSTNEELQTAKEELQSTNEELSTVNDEIQHRILEAVQLSDDLTNLFRNINLPVVMVGQDLRIRRFTPAAAALFNLIPGDIGRPLTDIKPRLVGETLHAQLERVLTSLVGTDEEVQDENGHTHLMTIRPYRTQDNRLDGAVISVVDIDAMKRVETVIRTARDYAESIIYTIDLPLVVLDDQLQVVSANQAFLDSTGTSASAVLALGLDRIPALPWYSASIRPWLEAALLPDAHATTLEVTGTSPEGPRTFMLAARALPADQVLGPRLLVRVEEITARRMRESQQRHAQKMEAVGQLATGVAHEFNGLLTIINGYANLLRPHLPSGGKPGEMLAAIIDAGERAARITGQLLAFSRRSMLHATVVDLRILFGEFRALLRQEIGDSIAVEMNIAPDVFPLLIDSSLLTQILLNLSLNARDAMPDGGRLTFNVGNVLINGEQGVPYPEMRTGEYVRMVVTDTGHGIEPEQLPRVFDPFFTTKEVGEGTGLGLASVYGAVKQCGGYVYVDSTVGIGTTFTLFLPRVSTSAASSSVASPPPASSPGGQTTS